MKCGSLGRLVWRPERLALDWLKFLLSFGLTIGQEIKQIFTVTAALKRSCQLCELAGRDIPVTKRYFLRTGHFHSLPLFERLDEDGGLGKRIVSARVKPGVTATHNPYFQRFPLQVEVVEVRDFQFSPRRRNQGFGHGNNLIVVKIEARDGETRFRVFGLFLD